VGFLGGKSKGTVSARAQLTTFHDSKLLAGSVNPGGSNKSLHSTFVMRVTPEDGGAEFESHMSVWGNDADHLQPGRWTYVRYDPNKPDHCDLDKDRLQKEFGSEFNKHPVMAPREVGGEWSGGPAASAGQPAGDATQSRQEKLMALARDPAAMQQFIADQRAAAGAAQPPAASPAPDVTDQLTKLADLRDRGALTQAEFDAEKAKLLAGS
jgi:Short C-terminal domain